jgi:uncharacterized protein
MRFAVFFVVLFALLSALGSYVHRRAASLFGLSPRSRRILAWVLVLGVASMVVTRLARGLLPQGVLRVVGMAGSLVALSLLLVGILLGVVDLARALGRLAARLLPPGGAPAGSPGAETSTSAGSPGAEVGVPEAAVPPAPERPALSRRAVLAQGAASSAFLIGGGSSFYGALVGRHDYVIEEVAIPIPGLPRALDGFSIVQLSDIHLGLFVGEPEMRAAEELVRKARGDLVVLTGDLIDFDPTYTEHLGRLAQRLKPLAREGVAAIPGNHDHFTGVDATLDALERAGAQVLRNRGRVVGGAGGAFALLGVDDVWAARMRIPGGGPDLPRALASVPRDLPRVLLCHNPVFFPEAAGQVALQLSGHTHGGQVNLVVRPADWVLPYGYVAGLYERGESRLYVNRGFGTAGPPARVGAPPEVSRIVLVSA